MPLEIRPKLVQANDAALPTPPPSATTTAFAAPGARLVHICAGDPGEIEEGELVEYCSCAKKPKRNVRWAESGKPEQIAPIRNDPESTKTVQQEPPITRSRTRTNSLDSRSRTWHEPITVTSPELSAPTRALRDRRLRDLVIVYETGAKSRKRPRASQDGHCPPSVCSRPGTLQRVKPVEKDQAETPIKEARQRDIRVDVPHMPPSTAVKQSTSCQTPSTSAGPGPHPLPPRPLFGDSHPPSRAKLPFNLQDLASLPHSGQTPDPYFAARVDFLRVVAETIGLAPQDVVAPWMPHSGPVPCLSPRQVSTRDPRLRRAEEKDLDTSSTKRRRIEALISEDGSSVPSRQVPTTTVNPRIPKGISWMLNLETPAGSSRTSDKSNPGITRPNSEMVDLTVTD